ncbi:MAG: response regulator transcription factor [Bacteroidales bacterium]|nr:response regulator transcription factor [Bacteroidales bacterium]
MEKLKIIIVDDHEFFRKGLALTIKKFNYAEIVAEATNGQEFLDILKNQEADIVLMDIKMPLMDGIEATRIAVHDFPQLKIVALSMFGDEQYLQSMIDAGAKGFLLKNIRTDDLDRALKIIAEGKNYYSEELLTYFTERFSKKEKEDDFYESLTERELEILQLIAKGLTNQEIADKLFISVRTVTNHRANINSKTGANNTAKLIAFALKHNLINMDNNGQ